MLIRKPVSEVFEAFVNPAITSRFWFSRGSGRLDDQKEVQWDWDMYGFSVKVNVKAIEPNKRILIEWGPGDEPPTEVEWVFTAQDNCTLVVVSNRGFTGDGDHVVDQVIDSTGGFSFVLSGLKAYLEHNINLNLIVDHAPAALVKVESGKS